MVRTFKLTLGKRTDTGGIHMISDRRLYLTADKKVVEEGNPEAKTLLVGEGGELSEEDAGKYGLALEGEKIVIGEASGVSETSTHSPAAETVAEPGEKTIRMGEGEDGGESDGDDSDESKPKKAGDKSAPAKAPAKHK
jgi:hypothetical protein